MDGIHRQQHSSRQAFIVGGVFLAVICLYALFFIYPSYRLVSRTRQAVVEQTAKIDRLKILYPVLARSKTLEQNPFEHLLPFPDRIRIHRDALSQLSGKIFDTANHNQLTLFESDFDINSLKNDSRFASITVKLKGELFDFRRFLIDIIALDFFDSIENLSISSHKGPIKEFNVTLNIKIKKNGS
ncbi:hypothetical protein [Desulfobacula phenolica]|uniref:Type II secretion system (T2SS), protein M subtype b n=1 Tax=Desulfobacula phenolica TaxID=90732 RepID=A0A1H2FT73_9BACT|nr:hypothetical protein [Desulfobacula phenolica]SDU10553.1 hypothetical protein SAMN04487931_104328 [Desulfobacula phenolica]